MIYFIFSMVELDESSKSKFEIIYYKYRNMLFGYALRLLSNRTDAEDVLQEAFIKIAKNIKYINEVDCKETVSFIIVILRNTAYDFLRKEKKVNTVSIDEYKEICVSDKMIESLAESIYYAKIVNAIKNIPSPYSEALYMHFVMDLSVKETARLLERKAETVKMQLVRGKRILLKMLSEVDYE